MKAWIVKPRSTRFRFLACLLAGVVPAAVVLLAYGLNLRAGLAGCNVFWDGCLSVSRAVRSGPGLGWFKAAAFPTAAAMAWTFWSWPRPPSTRWIAGAGLVGAASFLVYAVALGTDGDGYRWMRRYGVVFYFAGIGLAQLLLARGFLKHRETLRGAPATGPFTAYLGLLGVTWGTGILSAFKRRLIDDPALVDRLQNVLEWVFAGGLSALFIALAFLVPVRPGSGEPRAGK
ncbi:MAG: hypothetical protein V2I57_00350 [Xanthomonadales bacterium]|jgi:hypothetical protein|nr:hypothetical protein [Xanthomonadales bacterium]